MTTAESQPLIECEHCASIYRRHQLEPGETANCARCGTILWRYSGLSSVSYTHLNTPRFITPGDQAAIALDVTNLSGSDQKVTVKLEALDPVGIVDGTRTVTLKDKQRTTLRFTASTTGSYGLGLMRLTCLLYTSRCV